MNFFRRHRAVFAFVTLVLSALVALASCIFALTASAGESLKLTVVIDAGHGGVDGGVTGVRTKRKESDVNLEISGKLQLAFEEAGFSVVQTRSTQAGLYGAATKGYKKRDMQKRAQIIAKSAPALVISVHQNYFPVPSRRGAQVFFRESNEKSRTLACAIQERLNAMPECVKKTDALKGDYYILNCSDYPSVIVECGFLSNEQDEALLLDAEYQQKLCAAITAGALRFLAASAALDGAGTM